MVFYVPGTEETDPKKQNMSLQQLGGGLTTATTNIATNTANIATNTTNIATNTTNISANTVNIAALQTTDGYLASPLKNTLSVDVSLNNNAFHDGPSCAQGTTGTWLAFGVVNVSDTTGAASMVCKLWDGATVVASSLGITAGANLTLCVSLCGVFTSPAGNIRISCADSNGSPAGKIKASASGAGFDSTLTVIRIA